MREIILPEFPTRNPFPRLYVKERKKFGVDAEWKKPLPFFTLTYYALKEKPRIIEVHWHYPLVFSKFYPLTVLKTLLFPLDLFIASRLVSIFWVLHNLSHHEAKYPLCDYLASFFLSLFCHRILVPCREAKDIIKRYFPPARKRRVLWHTYAHPEYEIKKFDRKKVRKKLGIPERDFVFITFGELRPYKRIEEIIRAFSSLERNAWLIVAGKPYRFYGRRIKKEVEKSKRRERILLFLRPLTDDELFMLLSASDCAVFAMRKVLSSGSVLLAKKMGLFIVAPDRGCIPSYGVHILYKEDLKKAMERALCVYSG